MSVNTILIFAYVLGLIVGYMIGRHHAQSRYLRLNRKWARALSPPHSKKPHW